MVINEDYFKDIEITDDDIRDDHDSHIPQEQDIATLDQHLKSHYEHCIIFSTKYMSDLEYIIYIHDKGSPFNNDAPFEFKKKCKIYH